MVDWVAAVDTTHYKSGGGSPAAQLVDNGNGWDGTAYSYNGNGGPNSSASVTIQADFAAPHNIDTISAVYQLTGQTAGTGSIVTYSYYDTAWHTVSPGSGLGLTNVSKVKIYCYVQYTAGAGGSWSNSKMLELHAVG